MPVSTEEVRRLLLSQPPREIAAVLKEWRADQRFSQAEAAVHLGVPVRTLQGWEAGRPLPYPSLLQRPVDITARTGTDFGFVQSQFPREFASFIDFIGATVIDGAIEKVRRKLSGLSPSVRQIHGDRYFFHEQWDAFTEGPRAFRLDLDDLRAVRAATLIAGINKIRETLTQAGSDRLRSMVVDNLQPDRDVRQIEHEIRSYSNFVRKRYRVKFADLEGLGNFDLLVETPSGEMEVECKTVTEDTGSQVKTDMIVDLSETFRNSVLRNAPVAESGLFVLTFNKPTDQCRHVAKSVREALEVRKEAAPPERSDFTWSFVPKPEWQATFDDRRFEDFGRLVAADPMVASNAHCIVRADKLVLGLALVPHKPTAMTKRIVRIFKDAADQCTGQRPAMLWLHFIGQAESEFIRLAQFSSAGSGAGLNAIVAEALHPAASPTDRTHVERIRFSAIPNSLTRQMAFGPTLLLGESVSVGGPCYDVPNPFCRFKHSTAGAGE